MVNAVPLVLLLETLKCMDAPSMDRLDHVRSLMPRYDLAVPNHQPVALHLISSHVSCAEMNCVAPACTCTQVTVPESFLGCKRVPMKEAWAKYPHQKRFLGVFEHDKTVTEKNYFLELDILPGILTVPRFGPTLLKVQLHKLLPHLDTAIVSDVDVAFVTELNNAVDIMRATKGAMIAGVADVIDLYKGVHNDVVHTPNPILGGLIIYDLKALRSSNFDQFLERAARIHALDGPLLLPEQDLLNEYAVKNPGTVVALPCSWAWLVPLGLRCDMKPDIVHGYGRREHIAAQLVDECFSGARSNDEGRQCVVSKGHLYGRESGRQDSYGYYTPPPPPPTELSLLVQTCAEGCDKTVGNAVAAVKTLLVFATVEGKCTDRCTASRARSLLQTPTANTMVITVTNATQADAQLLQNNIAAGNLVSVGIPANAVVVATNPAGGSVPLAAPSPVPLSPSNPGAANSVCLQASATRLGCQSTLAGCQTAQAILAAVNQATTCCACTVTQARALQQTPSPSGYQVTGTQTAAVLCASLPAGFPGCPTSGSKKGLLGLLGLLGLIPLFIVLLLCCLCLLRRKRRGQAMLFSVTNTGVAAPPPVHEHQPVFGMPPSLAPGVQCAP